MQSNIKQGVTVSVKLDNIELLESQVITIRYSLLVHKAVLRYMLAYIKHKLQN